jgi:hypothetical protein
MEIIKIEKDENIFIPLHGGFEWYALGVVFDAQGGIIGECDAPCVTFWDDVRHDIAVHLDKGEDVVVFHVHSRNQNYGFGDDPLDQLRAVRSSKELRKELFGKTEEEKKEILYLGTRKFLGREWLKATLGKIAERYGRELVPAIKGIGSISWATEKEVQDFAEELVLRYGRYLHENKSWKEVLYRAGMTRTLSVPRTEYAISLARVLAR